MQPHSPDEREIRVCHSQQRGESNSLAANCRQSVPQPILTIVIFFLPCVWAASVNEKLTDAAIRVGIKITMSIGYIFICDFSSYTS